MSRPLHRVVLTGASGGMGQAFAMALAAHSSGMVLVGRSHDRLRALQGKIVDRCPGMIIRIVVGDVTDACVQREIFDAAQTLPGAIDLLINAAGISEFHAFESQTGEAILRLVSVNLVAPIELTQLLLPLLKTARFAQVINVGSIFGYLGYPGFALYCATKFGLRGFSQALRRELSNTNVAVRYFAPRATRTPLNTPAVSAMNRALKTREDSPEEVARMLVRFIGGSGWERKVGFPERFYVFLNNLVPGINDKAIRGQLVIIRKHLDETEPSVHPTEEGIDR